MKKECEIVQDLLVNYSDNILNKSSNELVEKHLSECEDCKKMLEEIVAEENKDKKSEKKEIDYLKKYRRKMRIKSVITAIVILVTLIAIIYIYKLGVILKIRNQNIKILENENNVYIEQVATDGDNGYLIYKKWIKDEKYKEEVTFYNAQSEVQNKRVVYGKIGEKEYTHISEEHKEATIVKEFIARQKKSVYPIPNQINYIGEKYEIIPLLGAPFYVEISKDTKHIGSEYWIIKNEDAEEWIDIETGKVLRRIGYTARSKYYENSQIIKEWTTGVDYFKYDFGNVKDEDVRLPDLEGYNVTYQDFEKELQELIEAGKN